MSIIDWPAGARIKRIEWTLDQPGMAHRAEFSGARRVTLLPIAARWSAKVELAPIIGEANVLAWRAFLVGLRGVANAFYLPATEGSQIGADPHLVVDGANQGGYALKVRAGAPGAVLKRGFMVSIADLMVAVMADTTVGADGKAQVPVEPYLRYAPSDGVAVGVKFPACLVSMKTTAAGWSVDPGQLYGISFEVEEAW